MDDDFSVFRTVFRKKEKNKEKGDQCKECGSKKIENDYAQGITYCTECGTHQSNIIISLSPEWKSSSENTLNRCNCIIDPLLSKMSMSTRLVGVPKHINLVHSWHTLYTYKEHSLSKAFKKMEKISQENSIPVAVVRYAQKLYKIISDKDLKRGASRIGIMGACIYYGCKVRHIMMKEKEIARNFGIETKYVVTGCDTIAEYLFQKGMDAEKVLVPYSIYDYVEEFCDLLDVKKEYKDEALRVAFVVDQHGSELKNMPYSLAAGCIYFIIVLNEGKKSQKASNFKKNMKVKCDLSDVTIAKCSSNLAPLKEKMMAVLKGKEKEKIVD